MEKNKDKFRVIFAGGGTGGHLYPAIAMYESLKEACGDVEVLFVGAKGGIESRLLPGLGLPFVLLPGRGLRGASLAAKLRAPFVYISGLAQGIKTIAAFSPDVVVGTGGYASVSIVVASIICRKPRVLQEQNSVAGLVNRRLARFADLVLLSYEESKTHLSGRAPVAVIGNPLRRTPPKDRDAGARFFGLDPKRPTVLIVGGSRGAHSLNVAASAAASQLLEDNEYQFIFLCGENDRQVLNERFESYPGRVIVRPYLDEMHHAYSVADLAVARAGASSVFELAAFAVPSIFVPYPYAADDHQRLNVEPLLRVGGAEVIADADLNGDDLAGRIVSLVGDPERRRSMSEKMRDWVKPDAGERAAVRIVEMVKKKRGKPIEDRGGSPAKGLEPPSGVIAYGRRSV